MSQTTAPGRGKGRPTTRAAVGAVAATILTLTVGAAPAYAVIYRGGPVDCNPPEPYFGTYSHSAGFTDHYHTLAGNTMNESWWVSPSDPDTWWTQTFHEMDRWRVEADVVEVAWGYCTGF